jgi:GAF domain-containing protein
MSTLPPGVLTAMLGLRLDTSGVQEILDRLVLIARDGLDGLDGVSITLVHRDHPYTAAYSGELALAADELQYERGYGPCIDAGVAGTVLLVADMRVETRWPDYAAAVLPMGVLGSLSYPLPLQTDLVGALNCYSRTPHSVAALLEPAGEMAAHVAVAIGNAFTHAETARYADDMRAAMDSRAVIEQAKGVIMAQNRCNAEHAFAILRQASMGRNVKLRDIASAIVAAVDDGSRNGPGR